MIGQRDGDGWSDMVQKEFVAGITDVFARTYFKFAVPRSEGPADQVTWGFLVFTSMNDRELGGVTDTKTKFLPQGTFDLSQNLIRFCLGEHPKPAINRHLKTGN
jgi:hypothetical protein